MRRVAHALNLPKTVHFRESHTRLRRSASTAFSHSSHLTIGASLNLTLCHGFRRFKKEHFLLQGVFMSSRKSHTFSKGVEPSKNATDKLLNC